MKMNVTRRMAEDSGLSLFSPARDLHNKALLTKPLLTKSLLCKVSALFLAAATLLLLSCRTYNKGGEMAGFTAFIASSQARTAMSKDFSFAEAPYTYTLIAKNEKRETAVFENQSYSVFGKTFYLEEGNYTFTLKAICNFTEAFTGTVEGFNLSGSGKSLSFTMKVCPDVAGLGKVTLELPDTGVASVMAGIASSPFAKLGELDYSAAGDVEIDFSQSPARAVFSSSDFYTKRTQFAVFYLLDINNQVIAIVPESVTITPGYVSESFIRC